MLLCSLHNIILILADYSIKSYFVYHFAISPTVEHQASHILFTIIENISTIISPRHIAVFISDPFILLQ